MLSPADSGKRLRASSPGSIPPPKRLAAPGDVHRGQAVVFTDLPPELRAPRSFVSAFSAAYPDHLLRAVSAVSLLRDSSGFLVKTKEAGKLLSFTTPAVFQGVTVRSPHRPKKPEPRHQCLLHGISTEELVEELKDELNRQLGGGVVSVERFHRRGESGPDLSKPLTTIRVTLSDRETYSRITSRDFRLYGILQVQHTALGEQKFTPHCSRCLKWGHRTKSCASDTSRGDRCFRCGTAGHRAASCNAPPKCHNCSGAHATRYRGCPFYKEATTASLCASTTAPSASPAVGGGRASRRNRSGSKTSAGPHSTLTRHLRHDPTSDRPSYAKVASATATPTAKKSVAPTRVTRSVSASAIPRPTKPVRRPVLMRPPSKSLKPQVKQAVAQDRPEVTESEEDAFQLLERALQTLLPPPLADLLLQVIRLLIPTGSPKATP